METESEDQKVRTLTSAYPEHFEIITTTPTTTTSEGEQGEGERHKVLCKLTKHELPLNAAAIETYINGKKFQTYLSKVRKPGALVQKLDEKYASLFRPSKKFPVTRLYCTLTRKEINKQPHDVEKYITGYKFRKALDKHRQRKEKGEAEPEPEEEEEVEKESADADADAVEEAMEDPFYALSSEGEEEVGEADQAGDMDDNEEVIDDEETVEEIAEDDDENNISKVESENIPSAAAIAEALCENIPGSTGSGSGKKRKSKNKKDKKKNKKLKAAGLWASVKCSTTGIANGSQTTSCVYTYLLQCELFL